MATAIVVLIALAVIIVVVVVARSRVRDAHHEGDVRAIQAGQDAETRAAEALRQRDLHVATYRFTEADMAKARHQAVTRSRAVVSGKVQEHLAPLFPEFLSEFNPREARFIGSPIDYVVFKGLDEGECEIVLVEVKTGRSQLSQRERRVRRAVEAGHVRWVEMRLREDVTGIPLGEVENSTPVVPFASTAVPASTLAAIGGSEVIACDDKERRAPSGQPDAL